MKRLNLKMSLWRIKRDMRQKINTWYINCLYKLYFWAWYKLSNLTEEEKRKSSYNPRTNLDSLKLYLEKTKIVADELLQEILGSAGKRCLDKNYKNIFNLSDKINKEVPEILDQHEKNFGKDPLYVYLTTLYWKLTCNLSKIKDRYDNGSFLTVEQEKEVIGSLNRDFEYILKVSEYE